MGLKVQKLEIKLEQRGHFYRPNDIIIGELFIKLSNKMFMRQLSLDLVGIVQVLYNGYVTHGHEYEFNEFAKYEPIID